MRDRVVARLVDAVAGPAFRETLAAEGSTLDGRISVRCYANENDEQGEEGQASWGRHGSLPRRPSLPADCCL